MSTSKPRQLTLETIAELVDDQTITLPLSAVVAESFEDSTGSLQSGAKLTFLLLKTEEVAVIRDAQGEELSIPVDPHDRRLFQPLSESSALDGKLFVKFADVVEFRPCPRRLRRSARTDVGDKRQKQLRNW